MTDMTTKLVKDGNSMAIRLPKQVITMSVLSGLVKLSVKRGQITIRTPDNPRHDWSSQIYQDIALNGPLSMVDEFGNMSDENNATLGDGLK